MRLLTTTCLLTAGVALAHVPQNPNHEPRQPMITPAPALKERQAPQDIADLANQVQKQAAELGQKLSGRDIAVDGEGEGDWQGVVSSAQSVASSFADAGESAVGSAQSVASSWADAGASVATSVASAASSVAGEGAAAASSVVSQASSVIDSAQSAAGTAVDGALSSASAALDSAKSILATATGADQASASSAVASASSAAASAATSVPDNAAPGAREAVSLLPMGVAAAAVLFGAMML